jgi:peptidoglycan/LPS O-acetylase OafA/YrhL
LKSPSNLQYAHRVPSLDGLRTLSIGLVILAHGLHQAGIADHNLGSLGVRVFFVISGFLITGILLREIDKTGTISLSKFYFRRTLRIFPPYYFYLIVLLGVLIVGGSEIRFSDFLPAFTYTSNYLDVSRWELGHTWSLAVEEQFYLIYPGLFLLLGRRPTIVLLLCVVLIGPLIRFVDFQTFGEARWVGFGFHSNADALSVGCLLALFRDWVHSNSKYVRLIHSRIIIIFPILILLFNDQADHPRLFAFAVSVVNILIAFCIDWAVTNHSKHFVGKFLNTVPMTTLGVMSYSIYLWQQPFLNPYSDLWFTKFPANLIGIAFFSSLSYLVIERQSYRLRSILGSKLFPADSRRVKIPTGSISLEVKNAR